MKELFNLKDLIAKEKQTCVALANGINSLNRNELLIDWLKSVELCLNAMSRLISNKKATSTPLESSVINV